MAKKRAVNLQFPLGGVNKRFAVQKQPPFTTVDALNVRPDGVLENRLRGGSRPGLGKAYATELGSGSEVTMLAQVRAVSETQIHTGTWKGIYEDQFDGSEMSSDWEAGAWDGLLPEVSQGYARCDAAGDTRSAALTNASTVASIGSADRYLIRARLYEDPYPLFHFYYFFLRMDDTTPNPLQNSVYLELGPKQFFDPDRYLTNVTLSSVKDGIFTQLVNTLDNVGGSGWHEIEIAISSDTVKFKRDGIVILDWTAIGESAAGSTVGFGMETHGGFPFSTTRVDWFEVESFALDPISSDDRGNQNFLVASANGSAYIMDDTDQTGTAITSDFGLASNHQTQAVHLGGKLYIADHGIGAVGTDGSITSGGKLSAASISDWTAVVNKNDFKVTISSAVAGDGQYSITLVETDGITLTSWSDGPQSSDYRVERLAKVLDPIAETLTLLAPSAGAIPLGASLIAVYRSRLVLAADSASPWVWYMSAEGDPTDYNYGGTGVGRAVAGLTTDAGQHPEIITALAPFHDDYLLFGGLVSLWVLRGNPATVGGFLDNISRNVGIIGKQAWCFSPEGVFYFMSLDGLYMLQPSASGFPISLSAKHMPDELLNISPTDNIVTLAYDTSRHGIHIFVVPYDTTLTGKHYWFSAAGQSLWPVSVSSDHHPHSLLHYDADSSGNIAVLLGCRDGFVRKFTNSFLSDDGTAISSHVLIGPIALGGGEYLEGKLKELIPTLDESSGDVAYSVLVGDSAEAASKATATTTGTITSGANHSIRPQGRGRYFYLKLANGDGNPWAVESIIAKLAAAGRFRK